MSTTHIEPDGDFGVEARIAAARLRLYDAAADLKPLPSIQELKTRVVAAAATIQEIMRDLLLVAHCADLDADGFADEINEIKQRLDAGWVPDSAPVDDVVERLRSASK